MSGFISRKIKTIQTLGEKLAKHRVEKGFAIEKAARAINVNIKYLKNIETNKYKALPADVYTCNILKSYAELLDLNPTTVIDIFKKEKKLFLKTRKKNALSKITYLGRCINVFLNPRTIKYFLIGLVLIAILSYIGLEVNSIISPPKLFVESPENNLITLDNRIEIKGKTDKEMVQI